MEFRNKPHFIIKKNLQKSTVTGNYFSDVVTPEILSDVCYRITGKHDFTYLYVDNDYEDEFLESSYNKGRMAIMQYHDEVSYITFSEAEVNGRNSSVQSVPTAFNMFYRNQYPKKRLYYYFINTSGNTETNYQILMYRLMSTVGFVFLNASVSLSSQITAFSSIEDIIFNRKINAGKNRSNNSTFINKRTSSEIEVYGKTYGANKYETSLICYALANLWKQGQNITLYEVLEGDLKQLPAASLDVIKSMKVIKVVSTDMTLEKKIFEKNNSLRSPRYLYNLFNKLGNKRCALCNCEIPELIQGAHIWPVADIKKSFQLTSEEKLKCAIDGDNGIWLCENHHKMFDEHFVTFGRRGEIIFSDDINTRYKSFIDETIRTNTLPNFILTDKFIKYLNIRNGSFICK